MFHELVVPIGQVLLGDLGVARDNVHTVVELIVRVPEQSRIACNTMTMTFINASSQPGLGLAQ